MEVEILKHNTNALMNLVRERLGRLAPDGDAGLKSRQVQATISVTAEAFSVVMAEIEALKKRIAQIELSGPPICG